ncbi:methionyl-tRNA formyltransferase [Phragmitibacter flavus]|uniref:Methionyl-tRNA formyltransferase n=1 Tax=Phragmitibacter flavus TaxID=2576071 RepID=A0A5R8KHP8_9BACT|nr:methionyl-tRNA formyltransferase [Phragmitibacter flavus]TLD71787.1 methionyl-tRNA formyltransferase [Phragmitibacter flavus]
MRLVFLATGDIGLPSLEALIASKDHELVAVVTQPDKPVGRKLVLTPPQIKVRALEAGLPVLQPEKIRLELDALKALNADVFVVVAYGQLLPASVLNIPRLACLNIHASLLPRHRGASPIQAAIREGDFASGITIMWMDEGLDTGPILLQHETVLQPDDTGGSLHDRLAAMAPAALAEALALISSGNAPKIAQDHDLSTHSRKLERAHGKIDWSLDALRLERLIRAYQPWPGTYCLIPTKNGVQATLKIHSAHVVEHSDACPIGGTILSTDGHLLMACGSGVLELREVQLEGRKRMPAAEFVRGQGLRAGDVLS